MKTLAAIVTCLALLLIAGISGAETTIDAVIPVPTGQQVFNYPAVASPVAGSSASTMKPLGVGAVAGGGDTLSLRLTMGQFAKAVDIYVGYYAPAIDDKNTYLFTKNAIQPLSKGLVAWKKAVTSTDDILAGDIKTDDLPEGKYTFYILATLTDKTSEYYLWITEFTVKSGGGQDFNLAFTLADQAQSTTIAFSGLAMITGNLEAQSFFPPGKVADYTGFQYLRDNDPDKMGHNTSFLTRIANNIIYILNDNQFGQLKTLAVAQIDQINLYGYKRYPLMKAFRRLFDGDIPSGSAGLNLNAVKKASRELYIIDGQISFDRALLYANIIKSMDSTQKAYIDAMKGKGWKSWPDITNDQIKSKMQGLPQGTAVAVMTYASDLFSWYAGSVEADVYFCPERQGTYYGSFYIKDAPAIGHEGYSIDEQLTATAGSALIDSTKGYVTKDQATIMLGLVDKQRANLYASSTSNIVMMRTKIATLLRNLLTSTATSDAIRAEVLALSGIYGDLDGENNYYYANVFTQIYKTMTKDQLTKLSALRKSIMSGKYSDGTPFDYSVSTTFFLYSEAIKDTSVLSPYVSNTDYLFFEP